MAALAGRDVLERPSTPFLAMHSAVTLLALDDRPALDRLAGGQPRTTTRPSVRSSLPWPGPSADWPPDSTPRPPTPSRRSAGPSRRLGGSDAQREIIEETRIAALVRADRLDEARELLDARLDRRHSPRDRRWHARMSAPRWLAPARPG